MSYIEHIHIIKTYLNKIDNPSILEIGIETGTITYQILTELVKSSDKFFYYGIDIYIQDKVRQFGDKHKSNKHLITLQEENSLVEMPKLINKGLKFDLILLDGDHNCYTLSKELKYVKELMHDNTVIIVDDYHGPWALIDYWYGNDEQSAQVNNPLATQKKECYIQGIHAAVHNWLRIERDWELYSLAMDGRLLGHRTDFTLIHNKRRYYHAVLMKKKGFNDELLA